jgi:hypothetical protein
MASSSSVLKSVGSKRKIKKDQILSEIERQNRSTEPYTLSRHFFLTKLSQTLQFRLVQFFFFYLTLNLFLFAQKKQMSSSSSSSGVAAVAADLESIRPLQLLGFIVVVFTIDSATTCMVS